jgi:toxin ParE1/3/4
LKWGKAQRNTYLKNLETRFAWLASTPLLGKHRTDIHEGFYSFPQGEHLVFYMMQSDGIAIIGIPHKEMDILSYFTRS